MVEITFFPGRSLDTKRRLYRAIAELMQRYGVPPDNCRIVLVEVPRENWSIRQGRAACDVDLGLRSGRVSAAGAPNGSGRSL